MSGDPFRILVVCTANICRSVMAERMLRREVAARDLDIEVTSCGILFDGEPPPEKVLAVLDDRGIDARDHRSRKFTPSMLYGVDLVVTMERMHARELAVTIDGSSSRIHTLGALVEWLSSTDELPATPADRVAACAAQLRPGDLLGTGPDEVGDPHGRSNRLHRQAADRIDALCRGLLDGLMGPVDG